jgi:outer membrane protein OmpA-like peptidoglycan-associated protein
MKKYILSLIIAIVFSSAAGVVSAQSKAADKLFSSFLYSEALYKYEGIKNPGEATLRNMAESYIKTSDPFEAEACYVKLFEKGNVTADDVWNYAEVLKMNKKYADAIARIKQYDGMKPGEKRTALHLADLIYYDKLMADGERFAVKELEFNSEHTEYAPAWYNAQVVFVSSRPIYTFTAYEDGWTDKRYTNLFGGYDVNTKKGKPTLASIREVHIRGRLSKQFHEGPASFTTDGLTMIFTRDCYKKKKELGTTSERKLELWMSKLDVDGTWRNPVALPFNNLEYNVGQPAISSDGKTLYFISDMPGGFGGTDIYKCSMTLDGVFGPAQNLGNEINTEGDEMYPFIHEKNVLFFASNGHAGLGGLDVFCTKITNEKPGKITNLGGSLNSSMDDYGLIMDISMKRGFFSSNRLTGKGSDDIYGFDVVKPLNFNKSITGIVKDKDGGLPLAGATVKLYNSQNEVMAETVSDANGTFSFDAEPNLDFSLTGNAENYREAKKNASTKTEEDIITVDLTLEKMLAVSIACLITDKKKGVPLDSVHVTIKDKFNKTVLFEGYTDKEGQWRRGLEKNLMNTTISYTIDLSKRGYLEKEFDWSYQIYKEEEIKMHEYMDFTMGTLEIGVDLAKLLGLKPIYFDKGKWDIRPDAALELEKIVTAMTLYQNIVIELDSHTDCRSTSEANHLLSQKRADASVAYIVGRGISADRISGKGMGEDKPVNGCVCEGTVRSTCTEDEHGKNRRTEFLIVDIKN